MAGYYKENFFRDSPDETFVTNFKASKWMTKILLKAAKLCDLDMQVHDVAFDCNGRVIENEQSLHNYGENQDLSRFWDEVARLKKKTIDPETRRVNN